jgi:CBS domain-containing protein
MPLGRRLEVLNLGRGAAEPGVALWLSGPVAPRPVAHRPFSRGAWLLWGLSRPTVNLFVLPVLAGLGHAVGAAGTVDDIHEVLTSGSWLNKRLDLEVRVEKVITPLTYRIYPDTPLPEVQHLLMRRRLTAVPVVGANHEILGVITVGDILPHMLPGPDNPGTQDRRPVAARDVMTRAVLCVSEDEPLIEAGRSMIARGVRMLPVVRDAELIGFLEQETVMRAFADTVLPSRRSRTG